MTVWLWFLIGLGSVVLFLAGMYLILGKKEFFDGVADDAITLGQVSEVAAWGVGGIIAGPVTTIAAIVVLIGFAIDSNRVIWEPKKDE